MAEMICHMCGQGYMGKHECNDVHLLSPKPSGVCHLCGKAVFGGEDIFDTCEECKKEGEDDAD